VLLIEYISVAAVTAADGFALTARHFFQTPKSKQKGSPRASGPSLGSAFLRCGIHPGTLPSGLLRDDLHAACSTASNGAARHSPDAHLHSASRRGGWIKIKAAGELTLGLMSGEQREQRLFSVGASLLAMNVRATRAFRQPASSLTTIVGALPGADLLLQAPTSPCSHEPRAKRARTSNFPALAPSLSNQVPAPRRR
jgi:hypothetical protein